jgi:hypothetical protein
MKKVYLEILKKPVPIKNSKPFFEVKSAKGLLNKLKIF